MALSTDLRVRALEAVDGGPVAGSGRCRVALAPGTGLKVRQRLFGRIGISICFGQQVFLRDTLRVHHFCPLGKERGGVDMHFP